MLTGSWVKFRIKPESVLEPLQEVLGPANEELRGRRRLRDKLREALESVEQLSPAALDQRWAAESDRIGRLEQELREAGVAIDARDRGAAHEVESATEELAASARAAGSSADDVRSEVVWLSESEGGRGDARARLTAATHDLTEARKDAEGAAPSEQKVRAALERLRAALREAEEALDDLAA